MNVVQLGARVEPLVKKGIEKAAQEESRTMSSLVNKVLKDWLAERKVRK